MTAGSIFQSLRKLTCFAAVAEAGSIRGGAAQLGLSVSVVSTALAELEEELGLALAIRSTRSLELTPVGQSVFEYTQDMLSSADGALNIAAEERKPSGALSLTTPVELCTTWLPHRLVAFQSEYPDVDFDINTNDSVIALRNSPYDLAIQAIYRNPQFSDPVDKTLVKQVLSLGRIALVCVASKKPKLTWKGNTVTLDIPLIEQAGRGVSLSATRKRDGRSVVVTGSRIITINNHESALALAKAGLGAVMLMRPTVTQSLSDKSLVSVMPGYDFGQLDIELRMRDRLPSPQAKAFARFVERYKEK